MSAGAEDVRRQPTKLFGGAGVVSRCLLVATALVGGEGRGRPERDQGGGEDDFTHVGLQLVGRLQTVDLNRFQRSRKSAALQKWGGPFTDRPANVLRPAGTCAFESLP